MRKRRSMAGWFNPQLLIGTAIRVAISTVFGQFADRREAMAAANAIAPQPPHPSFDYSKRAPDEDLWIDFLADTGDGWDPTYAMAQLVSEDRIAPAGLDDPLPRGRILVLGGDQVYPTASHSEYDDRFLGPFEEAYAPGNVPRWSEAERPDLYALPGNHDWYDGLGAFVDIFCRRRIAPEGAMGIDRPGKIVGGRQTQQTRSYFALKLPDGWWLWGTDSALEGYIDQPQIEYFQWVARHWMDKGSKLILCVAQPSWAYVDVDDPAKQFERFSYLERLAANARGPDGEPMGHELKLVLTGDSHHYARYVEGEINYVTCGGGGAFLHPTHHLEDKSFEWDYPPPGVPHSRGDKPVTRTFTIAEKAGSKEKALFPDRKTSWRLSLGDLLFPWRNLSFPAVHAGLYMVFNWLLNFHAMTTGWKDLAGAVAGPGITFEQALWNYVLLIGLSPMPLLLMLIALGGYIYFADARGWWSRIFDGFVHAALQTTVVILTTIAVLRFGGDSAHRGIDIGWLALASLAAAIAGTTLFGLYLLFNLSVRGRQWDPAFSALRVKDYKSFLRLRIGRDGALTVYPIGLRKVPKGEPTPVALAPHLIEPPIVIRGRTSGRG
jgi:hypothetical protein